MKRTLAIVLITAAYALILNLFLGAFLFHFVDGPNDVVTVGFKLSIQAMITVLYARFMWQQGRRNRPGAAVDAPR